MRLRRRHSPLDRAFGSVTLACRDPISRFSWHGSRPQRDRRHLRQRPVDGRRKEEARRSRQGARGDARRRFPGAGGNAGADGETKAGEAQSQVQENCRSRNRPRRPGQRKVQRRSRRNRPRQRARRNRKQRNPAKRTKSRLQSRSGATRPRPTNRRNRQKSLASKKSADAETRSEDEKEARLRRNSGADEESPAQRKLPNAAKPDKKSPAPRTSQSPARKKKTEATEAPPKRIEKAEPAKTPAPPEKPLKTAPEPTRPPAPEPPARPRPVLTAPLPQAALPSDITVEKSGLEKEQGLEPPPSPPPRRGFWPWSRQPANYRYLTSATIDAIRRAPVQRARWKFVIVHNSGTRQGNARAFDYYHRKIRRMRNGLAYHFVIGNGTSSRNGQIEIGDRWRRQINGGHVHSDYMNNIGLGICLVGDFNRDQPTRAQLEACEELIRYLRERCGQSDGRSLMVRPHREVNPPRWSTDCPGRRVSVRLVREVPVETLPLPLPLDLLC